MSKEGSRKFQINMFIGAQSFILRTDSLKEVLTFAGIKKLTSDKMRDYLFKMGDLTGFIDPATGTPPAQAPDQKRLGGGPAKHKQAPAKTSPVEDDVIPGQISILGDGPDYLAMIKDRLKLLGANTKKKELKLFNQYTGSKAKRLPNKGEIDSLKLQQMYSLLLRGQHNGKK